MSDTVRDILWKSALVGGIVTATVQTAVAREPLGGQLRLAPRTSAPRCRRCASRSEVTPGRSPSGRHDAAEGDPLDDRLVVFWLTTAGGGGLLWLTLGHARTLHVLGSRTPLEERRSGDRLRALLARAGVDRAVELTCSSAIASPVALPGDEVCLPRRALLELAAGGAGQHARPRDRASRAS